MTHDPGWAYIGRNPAWICGGVEKDGIIYWSQPEIVLYSKHPEEGISYPDFIEDNGEFYITETQKTIARVHHIDRKLFDTIWNHPNNKELKKDGLLWEITDNSLNTPKIPENIIPKDGDGFTIQLLLDTKKLKHGIIIDGRDHLKQGLYLEYTQDNTIRIYINDGQRCSIWDSDRITTDVAHITVIVDGASGIISFVINGLFCDGGEERDYGFGRIDPDMKNISGKGCFTCNNDISGIKLIRFYNRYILTNEAVGNYRYDMKICCE
jgi:hypothetical protein